MYFYSGMEKLLAEKGISKTAMARELSISSATMAKIGRNEKVSDRVLGKIAGFLNCDRKDLMKYASDNALLRHLQEEKEAKISGGIYHALQIRLTYNSNHIEGSRLTEDQTRQIFETATILEDGRAVPVNDVIETVNHFRAVDYVIDHAEEPLTEAVIKNLHRLLKQGTKDSDLEWFAVGDYKKRENQVSGRDTALPGDVPKKVKTLLERYDRVPAHTLEDIVRFHVEFEEIHPFQDGNGRVGRLVALKECLKNDIVPFIIEDLKKAYYYRGIAEWHSEPGYMMGTCLDGQDTVKRLMKKFGMA